jgi:glucosamine--fructose-6-phosphate aminotransferase (isomerizing)
MAAPAAISSVPMAKANDPLPGAPDPWVPGKMPARRRQAPFHMTDMILAEPALAGRIGTRLGAEDPHAVRLAARALRAARERHPILLVGCGTSEHAAQASAEILREGLAAAGLATAAGGPGIPTALQAFDASLGDDLTTDALVIGISHEGGTRATNRALERAQSAGATVAIITVSDRSPGAAIADIVVTTEEMDQSWCHTVGYLSPIVAAAAVSAHVANAPLPPEALTELLQAGLAQAAIAQTEAMAAILGEIDRLIVLGSGRDRPAARELALKVEEGAHIPATMRDLETMLHGHLAGIDARTGVLVVLTDPAGSEERVGRGAGVLRAVREIGAQGAAILAERAAPELELGLTPAGRLIVPEAPRLPPAVATILGTVIPLQLLTERLARSRGVDPDPIRRDDAIYRRAAEVAS